MATPTTPPSIPSASVQPGRKIHDTLSGGAKCLEIPGAPNSTQMSRKKHVRRIQAELPLYRQQVHDLELQLTRYKLKSTNIILPTPLKTETGRRKSQNGGENLWNNIAERQLKERLRAERQQAELKESYNEMLQFSTEFHKLLTRAGESKQELQQRVRANANHKFWDFSVEAVDEVFSEQLVTIAKLHLEAQQWQSPSWSVHLGSELSMGRDIAKLDASVKAGVVLEARCGVVLPFQLEVATDAYWRFFRFDHSGKHFADQAPAQSTNLFARSFAVRTELKGYTSETEGKYTCRKYVGEDEATLVWSGMWNILSFGGVRFDGMQLHKQGFIKLRRVSKHGAGLSSTSTLVETSFETIPVFHDSVCDYEEQIKILITSLNQSHATMNDHFCHLMSDLLLEEDWKLTFRRGNVGSLEDNLYSCSLTATTSAFERSKRISDYK